MSDSGSPHAAQPASAGTTHADMQAVVVIHGMGEQRPMDTIKAFVKAVWETDTVITANDLPHPSQVWSKPDVRTGSLELRRITTRESIPSASFPRRVRTDLYELYWADLTAGSTWDQFTGWVSGLLFRPLSRVPRDVRLAWVALWIASLAARRIAETSPEFDALCELERAAAAVDLNPTAAVLDEYYAAQRRLRVALAARRAPPAQNPQALPDPRWLITDFVTLGSPLAHAEFLIAASADDLAKRKFERELPESPPLREELDPNVFRLAQATHKLPVGADFKTSKLISFPPPSAPHVWELHHAAPFAMVRWTNVYDTASLVFRGDIIGGPLANVFGPAIIDVDLKSLRGQSRSFTHTKYWELDGEPIHIDVLRAAVNLLDRPGDPLASARAGRAG